MNDSEVKSTKEATVKTDVTKPNDVNTKEDMINSPRERGGWSENRERMGDTMKKIKLTEEKRDYDYGSDIMCVSYAIRLGEEKVGDAIMYIPTPEEIAEELDMEFDPDNDWVHCDFLRIFEEYRNQGLGTQALEALADIWGAYTITPNNEDARRLYDRLGFEDLRWQDAYYTDQGFGVYQIK